MMNKKRLEVVVENKEEAIIAEKAGADRIEISISPERRGLTVDIEDITSIVVSVDIPAYVVIRPTFTTYEYSKEEFDRILHIIELCKFSGVKGITVGFLKEGKIDREKLQRIIDIKGNLEIVISRAIDSVIDYEEEIKYLISNKFIDYIQTSGSAETALDGRFRFIPMISKYPDKFVLSSGLDYESISKLLKLNVKNVVFQVNSGVRKDGTFNSFISFDKINEIKKVLDNDF